MNLSRLTESRQAKIHKKFLWPLPPIGIAFLSMRLNQANNSITLENITRSTGDERCD
jgi:hypothetical protein